MSRPKLVLKLELTYPGDGESLPRKFSVNRTLRARWGDPKTTTEEILKEIRDYKGSFIGDIVESLKGVKESESTLTLPGFERELDVSKWIASVLETSLLSDVNEGRCDELLDNNCIFELDGSTKEIGDIQSSEIKNVNLERLMILLAPRIKNILKLLSKRMD